MEDGYVERDGERYVVADPGSLLENWADMTSSPRKQILIPFEGSLESATKELMEAVGPSAALSGELAAELMAPNLPSISSQIHCADPDSWASLEHLNEVKLSALLSIGTPSGKIAVTLSDEGVAQFGSESSGFRVVSPAQLYVDLFRNKSRGREAAQEVRRRLLGF